jgi:hypothetical protein
MKGMEADAASHASGMEIESTPAPAIEQKSGNFRKVSKSARLDWALPINGEGPILPAPLRHKAKRRREIVALAAADVEMLRQLHERCEAVGMNIRKPHLLAAGLQLLASLPMGKFLAVLGPLEAPVKVQKIKKRKPPTSV